VLRRQITDAEKALWQILRNRQVAHAKFRRQHPIGPYVADFACLEDKLIIEADGGQHALNESTDRARAARLEALGFRILRFWNNEILSNPEGVRRTIEEALKAPHPSPLPQAGEGAKKSLARLRERDGPTAERWEGEGDTGATLRKAA
jgi:adenine-specific DNA-methyltransferase